MKYSNANANSYRNTHTDTATYICIIACKIFNSSMTCAISLEHCDTVQSNIECFCCSVKVRYSNSSAKKRNMKLPNPLQMSIKAVEEKEISVYRERRSEACLQGSPSLSSCGLSNVSSEPRTRED